MAVVRLCSAQQLQLSNICSQQVENKQKGADLKSSQLVYIDESEQALILTVLYMLLLSGLARLDHAESGRTDTLVWAQQGIIKEAIHCSC